MTAPTPEEIAELVQRFSVALRSRAQLSWENIGKARDAIEQLSAQLLEVTDERDDLRSARAANDSAAIEACRLQLEARTECDRLRAELDEMCRRMPRVGAPALDSRAPGAARPRGAGADEEGSVSERWASTSTHSRTSSASLHAQNSAAEPTRCARRLRFAITIHTQ